MPEPAFESRYADEMKQKECYPRQSISGASRIRPRPSKNIPGKIYLDSGGVFASGVAQHRFS